MEQIKIDRYRNCTDNSFKEMSVNDVQKLFNFDTNQFFKDIVEYINELSYISEFDNVTCDVLVDILSVIDSDVKEFGIPLKEIKAKIMITFLIDNKTLVSINKAIIYEEPVWKR